MPTLNRPLTRIQVDEENHGEAFWDAAQQRYGNAPDSIRSLLDGADEVWADAEEVASVERWCTTVEGYTDGPRYAPCALLFIEEEPQEASDRQVRGDTPSYDDNGSITGWEQP